MTFLVPALLGAMVLASAPIIIHLLNRRRFLRVDWAPMKYLKLTLKANRRRLRIEQWILLAVRTLAVGALIFAIARPVSSTTDLAGFLKLQGRASRVLVIDDSLSMGHETAGVTSFLRARQVAEQIVRALGPQDSLTICTSSQPLAPLIRHAQLEKPDTAVARIKDLPLSDVASAWPETLAAIDDHLKSSEFPLKEVILVTDLWASGWSTDSAALCDRWADEKVTLRIIDVGLDPTINRRVLTLTQDDPVALVDTEVHFTAQVRNEGKEPLLAEQALLSVDEVVQSVTLPDIAAGESVDVPLTLTFDDPGQHHVAFELPKDSITADNRRFLAVDVRRHIDVLLVDGDPGVKPFESETDFLALALTAGNSQWKAVPVIASEWMTQPLEAPDVLVIANVDQVTPERAKELEQLVEAGMGLIIFAGEQVDPQQYNDTLFKGGHGLLPAHVEQIREAESTGLVVEGIADSPLALLLKISPEALARVRPKRILECSIPADSASEVRVLARWNDARQTPAVIEKRLGQGRILFWTVSADRDWSDWPTEASFVLASRLAAQAVAARVSRWENLISGQPLRYPLDPQALPQNVTVARVGSEDRFEPQIIKDSPAGPEFSFAATRTAGSYKADWDEPVTGARTRKFAISPDARDSDPLRLAETDLRQDLGKLTPRMLRYTGESMNLTTEGAELWRFAAMIMIGLLLFESLFAAWIGRVR